MGRRTGVLPNIQLNDLTLAELSYYLCVCCCQWITMRQVENTDKCSCELYGQQFSSGYFLQWNRTEEFELHCAGIEHSGIQYFMW